MGKAKGRKKTDRVKVDRDRIAPEGARTVGWRGVAWGAGACLAGAAVVVWSIVGVVDWWAVGLSVAFLLEVRVIWRLMLPPVAPVEPPWWEEHTMIHALYNAGVLKSLHNAAGAPYVLKRVAGPTTSSESLTVAYSAANMPGVHVGEVEKRAPAIAAELRLPVDRFTVSAHNGYGHEFACTLTAPPRPLETRHPGQPVGKWSAPVLLGRTIRGADWYAPTWDRGSWLIAGRIGSGKTTVARLLVQHYAADPDAVLWGADGKGDDTDWAPFRPRFARWVDTLNDKGGAQYLAMLTDLQAEVDDRYRRKSAGEVLPGLLVFLDEASHLRNRLSDKDKDLHDQTLRQIVSTCRAASVLVAMVIQRPDASQWPTGVRSQASVTICMRVRATDVPLVFGEPVEGYDVAHFPDGQGLVDDGTEPVHFLADWMTDDLMADWCKRLKVASTVPQDALRAVPTLSSEVQRIVTAPMLVSDLLGQLPEALAPGSASHLSEALRKIGIEPKRTNKGALVTPEMVDPGVTPGVTRW